MHSQCKFGEESGSRHSLLVMTEKFKKSVDKGNDVFGALQTNLSNPYQTALIAHCTDCTQFGTPQPPF